MGQVPCLMTAQERFRLVPNRNATKCVARSSRRDVRRATRCTAPTSRLPTIRPRCGVDVQRCRHANTSLATLPTTKICRKNPSPEPSVGCRSCDSESCRAVTTDAFVAELELGVFSRLTSPRDAGHCKPALLSTTLLATAQRDCPPQRPLYPHLGRGGGRR
jgi:hypothetical protein